MPGQAEGFYAKGMEAFKNGNTLGALAFFERAFNLEPENPTYQSFLGICIARERGKISEAINLCEKAVQSEPRKIESYLNLGRVYLNAGFRSKSVEVFRNGLMIDNKNPEIIAELQALGLRKKPVFQVLSRNHILNKYLGIILSRLGFRGNK